MSNTRKKVLAGILVLLLVPLGWWMRGVLAERWSAIPARGGDPLSLAPIATPHFLQKDPRWENETVGGTGERLARVGCTLCSLSMALDPYGIKTNPKELNDFLKSNGGYNLRGWLKWNSVSNYSSGKVLLDYLGPPGFGRIDAALKESRPVIVKVYLNGVIPHWVLIVGKDGSEYLMRDPLGDGKTLGRVSTYNSKIYAIRTLKSGGSPSPPVRETL